MREDVKDFRRRYFEKTEQLHLAKFWDEITCYDRMIYDHGLRNWEYYGEETFLPSFRVSLG